MKLKVIHIFCTLCVLVKAERNILLLAYEFEMRVERNQKVSRRKINLSVIKTKSFSAKFF